MTSKFVKLVDWHFTHEISPAHLSKYVWDGLTINDQKYWSELCENDIHEIFRILNQKVYDTE